MEAVLLHLHPTLHPQAGALVAQMVPILPLSRGKGAHRLTEVIFGTWTWIVTKRVISPLFPPTLS